MYLRVSYSNAFQAWNQNLSDGDSWQDRNTLQFKHSWLVNSDKARVVWFDSAAGLDCM